MTMELALWALAGGVLNRFSGWADYLPGRNIHYAALAALGLVWAFYGWVWGVWVFVSFLCYRLPGWYKSLDIGTAPGFEAAVDASIMYLRGLFWAPVYVWAALTQGDLMPAAYMVLASLGAVAAYAFGNHVLAKTVRDPFWFIEFAAGACFGLALGATIVL